KVATKSFLNVVIASGSKLAYTAGDAGIEQWDIERGTLQKRVVPFKTGSALAVSSNGNLIAFDSNGQVQLWNKVTDKRSSQTLFLGGIDRRLGGLAFSSDNEKILSGGTSPAIFETENVRFTQRFSLVSGPPIFAYCAAFGKDSQSVVFGCEDGVIRSAV